MRQLFVVFHRWAGLTTALFLFSAGLTGAVIAWDHELDAQLNPAFHHSEGSPAMSAERALTLADAFEAGEPSLRVTYLPLATKHNEALGLFVSPRDGSDPDALVHNQFAVDPRDGRIQARRKWGALSLSREHILPMLYRLHYSLHLPGEWGLLLMGIIALVWTLDAFVVLWLSFPNAAQWRKSFAFRLRDGGFRALFDLHRSGGVWTWLLVLTLAVTAISMNLGQQVVRPLLASVSELTPTAAELAARRGGAANRTVISRAQALMRAQEEANSLGIQVPAGGLFHDTFSGFYGVGFFEPGNAHADGALGNPWLYVDASTGAILARDLPDRGTAADFFWRAQFPLHSGRLGGVLGRALVSLLGVVVAALSATGVLIWLKKRTARKRAEERKASL